MFIHKFTSTLFLAWRTWNEQRKCKEMVSAVQRGQNSGAWQGLKWAPLFGYRWDERKWMLSFVRQEFHTFWITRVYFLAGQSLGNDQKTKDTMQKQLQGLAVTFFDKGISKLVPQHDKWLNWHGTWCSSSFIQVPSCKKKRFFLKIL